MKFYEEHLEFTGNRSGPIDSLNDDFKIAIFRICQEASTNAVKHSLATEYSTDITYLQNKLKVIICDNGIGLSEQSNSNSKGGFGVLGIVERVSVAYFGAKRTPISA